MKFSVFSVIDVDNLVYMRLDDGFKPQPELMSKDLAFVVKQLEDIRKKCFGRYELVEGVIQQPCWSI